MPEIDFRAIAIGLAVLSFGLIGIIMAGSALWPQQTQQYKKMIPDIIIGLVIVLIASSLVAFFGGS